MADCVESTKPENGKIIMGFGNPSKSHIGMGHPNELSKTVRILIAEHCEAVIPQEGNVLSNAPKVGKHRPRDHQTFQEGAPHI